MKTDPKITEIANNPNNQITIYSLLQALMDLDLPAEDLTDPEDILLTAISYQDYQTELEELGLTDPEDIQYFKEYSEEVESTIKPYLRFLGL